MLVLRLSSSIKVLLVLWCLGEVLAFAIVAKFLGVSGAIFLGVATGLVGFVLLKRAGTSAMTKLRATVAGRGPRLGEDQAAEVLDDVLSAAGALMLVLPGFLSDIVGATLVLPALRSKVTRWIGRGGLGRMTRGRRSQAGPRTIDLDPREWRQADEWRRSDPVGRPEA